jgi:ABC-type long-subunit fatty acid transport system fused permease/ATPase subunit
MLMQADKPELNKLMRQQIHGHSYEKKSIPEDASVYVHLLIAYGIIEEAFILYSKKWIVKETWEQWAVWLENVLVRHPQFTQLHKRARGMYDKRFQDYVLKALEEK